MATPTLTSTSNASTWPATRAQKFFETYRLAVEAQAFNTPGLGPRYYSPSVIFHNTNGTIYRGAEQMWEWMRELFAPFERMHHPFEHCVEVANGDGTSLLTMRWVRQIWIKGHTGPEPDVSVPMAWSAIVGPAAEGEGQGTGGLQMKEVWLYWDTGPLMKFMKGDAVAFRMQNPADGKVE
jgi:hypothetical protein